jgi:DNA transformation protein
MSAMKESSPPPPELAGLKNIGRVTERWLNAIGIACEADLRRIGAVQAYRLIRGSGQAVPANLLYALQGALMGVHWSRLPAAIRELLDRELTRADRK